MKTISILLLFISWGHTTVALPPPEDTPEEVLRTEIILEARSPVDGDPLTPTEYAELQAELQEGTDPPEVAEVVQDQIFQLRLLELWDLINPF